MMTTSLFRRCVWLAACATAPVSAFAQNVQQALPAPATPTVGPPIQRIETASAVSKELLGALTGVRELPDGRILVNDGTRRRLLLMDTTLTTIEVVLDSLSEIANAYGTRAGMLVPARGDTTFFIDPASLAIVVIDPHGKIARVRSVWRAEHVTYVTNAAGTFGFPAVDAKGRIVYRIPARPAPPAVRPPAGVPYFPPQPDSAFIVAVDLDTRRLDTLAAIRIPKSRNVIQQSREGGFNINSAFNPLPTEDQWAVLPDGTVALVRSIDYRIEYLNTLDRSWASSQKLPYEWQRMTDVDKQRMVDSVLVAQNRQRQNSYVMSMIQWVNQYSRPYPPNFKVPEGFTLQPGLPKDMLLPEGVTYPQNYIYACAPGEQPAHQVTMPGAPMIAGAPGADGPARQIITGGAMQHEVRTTGGLPAGVTPPAGATPGPVMTTPGGAPSCVSMPGMFMMGGSGMTPPPPTFRPASVLEPDELPDYKPPIPVGAAGVVRADFEGNLWIRTVPPRPVPGGIVYDIVSRQGELVQRIQLPPGYTLLGFGRGKIVYLSMRDQTGLHLARVRLR